MDMNISTTESNDMNFSEPLVPVTVRLSKNRYFQTKELSERFSLSFASVARIALEAELENYLGTVKYIDKEQADKISEAVRELTAECREIKNNIKRIGINYNQEIRLKNITQKYHDVLNDKTASEHRRLEARKEYEDAVKSIDDTCLNKTELKELLERFNRIMKKIEEEGTFTLDISIDVPTSSVKVEKETVQSTAVTAPEISYETVSVPVEIEAEEQEFEYVPEHKKTMSAEEKATEEISVLAPVTQAEVQRAGVQLEQQVVVPPPIVDDEDDDDEIVKEVENYAKRENVQENFLAKAKRKIKEKVESKQRNLQTGLEICRLVMFLGIWIRRRMIGIMIKL